MRYFKCHQTLVLLPAPPEHSRCDQKRCQGDSVDVTWQRGSRAGRRGWSGPHLLGALLPVWQESAGVAGAGAAPSRGVGPRHRHLHAAVPQQAGFPCCACMHRCSRTIQPQSTFPRSTLLTLCILTHMSEGQAASLRCFRLCSGPTCPAAAPTVPYRCAVAD